MRIFLVIVFILLFNLNADDFQTKFPRIFSSTGDKLYTNMNIYLKIKNLDIYKNSPELLEAYCIDANKSLAEGLALDKMKDDPEVSVDKKIIKNYVKSLRKLSKQNELINHRILEDINVLYKNEDFKSLKKIQESGFELSQDMKNVINKREITKQKKLVKKIKKKKVQEPTIVLKKPEVKKVTVLEFYQKNIIMLRDELYDLRETNEQEKMACLNDITAINYWIIKILEAKNDACEVVASTKQMKSYDKSASESCGESSMRYIEWHGRMRPFVGENLFEAESNCLN